MIWPWRSNPVNKAMWVYLNFCLTGALSCSIMTYYLTLLWSSGSGKESPCRYNLLHLAKLFEWLSDLKRANYTASHNRHIRLQSLLIVLKIPWVHLPFVCEACFQCHFHSAAGDNLWHHTLLSLFLPHSLYLEFCRGICRRLRGVSRGCSFGSLKRLWEESGPRRHLAALQPALLQPLLNLSSPALSLTPVVISWLTSGWLTLCLPLSSAAR